MSEAELSTKTSSTSNLEYNVVSNMSNLTVLLLSYFLGLHFVITGFCGYLAVKHNSHFSWFRSLFMTSWYFNGLLNSLFYTFMLLVYEAVLNRDDLLKMFYQTDLAITTLHTMTNDEFNRENLVTLVTLAERWIDLKNKHNNLISIISTNQVYQCFINTYDQLANFSYKLEPTMWSAGNNVHSRLKTVPYVGTYYNNVLLVWSLFSSDVITDYLNSADAVSNDLIQQLISNMSIKNGLKALYNKKVN